MKSFITVVILVLVVAATGEKVDYSGHMVIRVVPQTEAQLRHLFDLEASNVNFWRSPSTVNQPVDIHVNPQSYYHLAHSFALKGIEHSITIADIGKRIEEEQKDILLRRAIHAGRAGFDFENYHTEAEIMTFLNELAATNPRVKTSVIGKTYDNFTITMVTLSTGSSATKPIFYLDCGMHSREWVAQAVCVWMINELATKYDSDSDVKQILDYADWLIVPVSNPEGYNFSWTNNRLWRKNRQPSRGALCVGTDPNRNFDSNFGGNGSSADPCNDAYHGPSAFSSPEAAAMRDVLLANRKRVKATVSIHAYSQYWMTPYGNNESYPPQYAEMERVMDAGVTALENTNGLTFKSGTIANVIYEASGSTADYAYDTIGVIYAYALELRDTGTYGFQLPPNQILPAAKETFNGMKAMAKAIEKPA